MSEERRDPQSIAERAQEFVELMSRAAREPYAGGVQRLIPDPVPMAQSRPGGSSPSWDLVQLINDAAHRTMHRINSQLSEFELDVVYDSPLGMGIRTVRIIVRGNRNRPTYSHNVSIRRFEAIDQTLEAVSSVLEAEVEVSTARWRSHENARVASRMTGTSVDEWRSVYEEMLEGERQAYALQIMREDSARPEHFGASYTINDTVATADWRQAIPEDQFEVTPEPTAAPWEEASPGDRMMPRRERLRRRRESRDNDEVDPGLVKSVLAKLKPIF